MATVDIVDIAGLVKGASKGIRESILEISECNAIMSMYGCC
jgi:ribosome-binding ATPase YchF (GTP1/OBG family)